MSQVPAIVSVPIMERGLSHPTIDKSVGYLTVIIAPMMASKTRTLINKATEMADTGNKVLLITHKIDDERKKDMNGTDDYTTHSSYYGKIPASITVVKTDKLGTVDIMAYDVIAVDEGQFFEQLFDTINKWVNQRNKTVFVAGLSGNYLMKPFGEMLSLIALADEVIHLRARCVICIQELKSRQFRGDLMHIHAPFTARTIKDDRECLVGGSKEYIPTCRCHHQENEQRLGRGVQAVSSSPTPNTK